MATPHLTIARHGWCDLLAQRSGNMAFGNSVAAASVRHELIGENRHLVILKSGRDSGVAIRHAVAEWQVDLIQERPDLLPLAAQPLYQPPGARQSARLRAARQTSRLRVPARRFLAIVPPPTPYEKGYQKGPRQSHSTSFHA